MAALWRVRPDLGAHVDAHRARRRRWTGDAGAAAPRATAHRTRSRVRVARPGARHGRRRGNPSPGRVDRRGIRDRAEPFPGLEVQGAGLHRGVRASWRAGCRPTNPRDRRQSRRACGDAPHVCPDVAPWRPGDRSRRRQPRAGQPGAGARAPRPGPGRPAAVPGTRRRRDRDDRHPHGRLAGRAGRNLVQRLRRVGPAGIAPDAWRDAPGGAPRIRPKPVSFAACPARP